MAIRTIVVALGLEEGSQHVADRAVRLANEHEARLIGVYVEEQAEEASHDSARRLQSLLKGASKPALVVVESGKPHDVIEALAIAHSANLIVIGPGAPQGLREKVFGSTADHIVRCASCPVLVVRNPVKDAYKRITAGFDFSSYAKTAAAFASRLAPAARYTLIHASEIPLSFEQAMLKAGTSQRDIEAYRNARANTAREQIQEVMEKGDWLPKATQLSVVSGDPAAAVVAVSNRVKADLVAIGTQGAGMLAQHLLGSVARATLERSECDALVVSAKAAQTLQQS